MASDDHFGLLKVDTSLVPPLPSREEELAYLDKFEYDLRHQAVRNNPPNPSRVERIKLDQELVEFNRLYRRHAILGGLLFAPLALWLTRKSPYRAIRGIPLRDYENQHVVRFWTFFAAFDFVFSQAVAMASSDKKVLQKYEFYLYDTRRRQL